ncbi:hypothetical protein AVEN_175360-1 [Araneus ventricosus]|uniref:Uncharacterized protein n=1 Tax=Araneus ventricosus TaxID=182803 RepID=A0A4Y2VI26_ARAVE|nr:hypothetical protein AVEN_175360-1 [Araneus ventricosus]
MAPNTTGNKGEAANGSESFQLSRLPGANQDAYRHAVLRPGTIVMTLGGGLTVGQADVTSKSPDSIARASPPITNLPISSSPSVSPVSEESLASPDFTDFKLVLNKKRLKDSPTKTNNSIAKAEKISKFYTSSRCEVLNTVPTKDNLCAHQSALKPFETKKPTSVDTQLLPMAVLPPLEKKQFCNLGNLMRMPR